MTDAELASVAAALDAARRNGTPLAPFTQGQPGFDVAAAYRVAGRVRQQRVGQGERVVGRKIGFTNRALWPVYGVDQPIWGPMYDSTLLHAAAHRGRCSLAGLAEPKIEPEIALRFASAPQAGESASALLQRIDGIAHAFEIVQSPYPGWQFGTADAVAAGSLHGLLLLGPVVTLSALGPGLETALAELSLALWCNGERIDQGVGANVLGSPLHALEHLQRALAHAPPGDAVQAGEWVSTGTITAAWPVRPGQVWHTTIEGLALPGLRVEFEA